MKKTLLALAACRTVPACGPGAATVSGVVEAGVNRNLAP